MTLENMRFFLPLLLSNGARSVRGNELAQRRSVCGVRWSALLGVSS
mgnify:CR=1 FL=1